MSLDSPSQSYKTAPELKMPEGGFKSTVPPHLLDGCDAQMKWLIEEVSKNTQATEFACRGVVALSEHQRELNGKTFRNERGLVLANDNIVMLKEQAEVLSPFLRPVKFFAGLWDYTLFKWIFICGLIFLFGIVYPAYVASPVKDWLPVIMRMIGIGS